MSPRARRPAVAGSTSRLAGSERALVEPHEPAGNRMLQVVVHVRSDDRAKDEPEAAGQSGRNAEQDDENDIGMHRRQGAGAASGRLAVTRAPLTIRMSSGGHSTRWKVAEASATVPPEASMESRIRVKSASLVARRRL